MGTKVTVEIEFEETRKKWEFTDAKDLLSCVGDDVFPASAKITAWED